jgi:hypothetical protein
MRALTSQPPSEPVPPLAARVSFLVVGVSGVLALTSTALLRTPHVGAFGIACAVVFGAAGWAPVIWPSPGGMQVRRLLSFAILAITMILFLAHMVRMGPTDGADLAGTFGGFLGRMLISVLLAQLFITDKMRDLRVALLLAVGMFVLAVANDPGPVVVVSLLVGWPALVIALSFAHASREESKADTVAHASTSAPSAGWARVGGFAAISGLVAVLVVLLMPHPDGLRRVGQWRPGVDRRPCLARPRGLHVGDAGHAGAGQPAWHRGGRRAPGQPGAVARGRARLLRRDQLAGPRREHLRQTRAWRSALRPALCRHRLERGR